MGGGEGMLEIVHAWNHSDELTITLPMTIRVESLNDSRPRYSSLYAVLCGPLLLAGLTHGPRTIIAQLARVSIGFQRECVSGLIVRVIHLVVRPEIVVASIPLVAFVRVGACDRALTPADSRPVEDDRPAYEICTSLVFEL